MRKIVIVLALLLSGCVATQTAQHQEPLSEIELLLESGFKRISERNTTKAIVDLDKAITLCKEQYSNNEQKTYASRGMTETFYYVMKAAADNEAATIVSLVCAEALYLRGYASLDLGKVGLAEEFIKRAVDMAPVNSMYLSELGHIYQTNRDWSSAFALFTEAEAAANTYSPPEVKNTELSRAKRGVGYSLIELGKLDEAKLKFEECLEINKNDQGALKELKYIEQLHSKKSESS